MVAPINYIQDVQTPFQAAAQGLQFGAGIQDMRAKQQAQQLQLQQAQQQQQQQQMIAQQMQRLRSSPTRNVLDYADLAMVLPKDQSKSMMDAWSMIDPVQQRSKLSRGASVLAAFNSGASDIGISMLEEEAAALRNSGDEAGAKAMDTYAKLAKLDPVGVEANIGSMIAQLPGGKDALEAISKQRAEKRLADRAPSDLTEAQAKAQKSAVDAKFAESNAVAELQKKGWDITKIQEDIGIAKQNSRIAAANAAANRESNQIKREEMGLKLQEMKQKRDELVQGKSADVEAARSGMDNMLNTADRILKTPIGAIKAATGPIDSRMPTVQRDVADFEALVDTLGSQAFISQIPNMKGMGALSNAEGEKLQAALQNFSLKQSPERLIENIKEAQRLILKGRANLSKRYGVPDSIPDTPAVSTGGGEIDALLKKYGAQ